MQGTFTGTLVNVRERVSGECKREGSGECGFAWVQQTSPNFARLCQTSHDGAPMLPVLEPPRMEIAMLGQIADF